MSASARQVALCAGAVVVAGVIAYFFTWWAIGVPPKFGDWGTS